MDPTFHADSSLLEDEDPSSATRAVPLVYATTDSVRSLLEEFALSDTVPELPRVVETIRAPAARIRPLSFSEIDEPGED